MIKIDKEVQQIINEMSMAWVNVEAKKCCWIENPNGYENTYFKYLNSFSYRKADSIARISLLEPKYLNHKNIDGKKEWKLTNKEKDELIELMNMPSESREGFTNWQATIIQYNFDNFYIQPGQTINKTFDKEKFPNALDIDLPMPDYTQLN